MYFYTEIVQPEGTNISITGKRIIFRLSHFKGGGGGGGFRPIISETLVLRYEFKGKARTRPEIFEK